MLFNKGNVRTPFLSMIGGKTGYTNSVEFVLGQEYATEEGEIPNISESGSLKAPDASYITRSQNSNVTQIFMDSVAISYAKMSNMGTLAGVNIAGQTANPQNELDFQIGNKMAKLGRSIEKTFMQGKYNKATTDKEVNKTRGMYEAITKNVIEAGEKPLNIWLLEQIVKKISDANGDTSNLYVWTNNTAIKQLHGDAVELGVPMGEAFKNEYGIRIQDVVLPTATVHIAEGQFITDGTALVLNFDVIRPIEQPVPGKGNFFLEPLSKTGAGEKYLLFGQIGLDYGNELFHGKITGLSTEFTPPKGRKVVTVSEDTP